MRCGALIRLGSKGWVMGGGPVCLGAWADILDNGAVVEMDRPDSCWTLYEDWQFRRSRLLQTPGGDDAYRQIQVRILNFLLHRYRNAPEARRTVPTPLTAELWIDDRAIIVHHHLARGGTPTRSSPEQAHRFIKSVLERMYSAERSDSPFPFSTTEELAQRLDSDTIRHQLCHCDSIQRILAAVELSEHGTLDDISLFCDLLKLPPAADEHPRERAAMAHAIARLAGVTSTDFDLTDIIPPPSEEEGHATCSNIPRGEPTEKSPGFNDWKCSKCGESVPGSFETCWSCGTTVDGQEDPTFSAPSGTDTVDPDGYAPR